MKTSTRIVAAGLVILGILACSGEVFAGRPLVRLVPTPGVVPVAGLPALGYSYVVVPGYGFRVTGVMPGSPAAAVGLEPGDIVLTINGRRLTYVGADVPARAEAARRGGWVRLRIRNVRTGRIAYRSTNLFNPYGPVNPIGPIYPGPIGPIGPIMPGPGSASR